MSGTRNRVLIAECPECEASIRFHSVPRIGDILTCPECDEQLEVRNLNPLELDWALDDDWDNDDDENWD